MTEPIGRYDLPIRDQRKITDTPTDARLAHQPPPAKPLRPPEGAPNVLIILVDDMGFGASSAYGGPCRMPHAERLGEEGIKFTRFHTTALCSPTRQALLTGRNHHTVNMGVIAEMATSFPGYTGVLPNDCGTLAQTLNLNGYSTAAWGKWHQTPPWETSQSGPFTRWPTSEGFDHFYGFIAGDTNQWVPALVDGTRPIEPPKTPEEGYHLSEDLVERAIEWTRSQHALTPDKPWFQYLAFGATHAPHHVPKSFIDEYKGKFTYGYDKQREMTIKKQKELGVIPEDAELVPHNDYIPRYDDLSDTAKKVQERLMEVYAGFATHTDAQVGKVLDYLEESEQLDNTLIFYILGDNGASGEAGPYGTSNEMAFQNGVLETPEEIIPFLDELGGPKVANHYSCGWAQAMCTPYQWSKACASHFGGSRTGMIVRYPKLAPAGETRHQFTHVIDVVPTILEVAGLPHPNSINGVDQRTLEGESFVYAMKDPDAEETHRTQYWEIVANRGIYHDGWSAVTFHSVPWPDKSIEMPTLENDRWELYAPDDWTQAKDVAKEHPEKLLELQNHFYIEGSKYNVFPIDDRQRSRYNAALAGRPDLMDGRTSLYLYPGMQRLNENCVLNIKNRSYEATAKITVGKDTPDGALYAQGGRFGGWTFYIKEGLLSYAHNWVSLETYKVRADKGTEIGQGEHEVKMAFSYDGGGVGKGGSVALFVDGKEVGKGRVEKTVPQLFSLDDGADVGKDSLDPVVDDYGDPLGRFNGDIEWVRLDIGDDVHEDPEMLFAARMMRQ